MEGTQEPIIQPIPMKLNPSATAQTTKFPLPVAPSTDQVYILPTPAPPAPKAKSNPSLLAMQNFKRLVASVQNFATTSKTQAAAYIAWHNGWFGCRFGFGAPESRHFQDPSVLAASKSLRKWFGGSTFSPTFCFHFFLAYFILSYFILISLIFLFIFSLIFS